MIHALFGAVAPLGIEVLRFGGNISPPAGPRSTSAAEASRRASSPTTSAKSGRPAKSPRSRSDISPEVPETFTEPDAALRARRVMREQQANRRVHLNTDADKGSAPWSRTVSAKSGGSVISARSSSNISSEDGCQQQRATLSETMSAKCVRRGEDSGRSARPAHSSDSNISSEAAETFAKSEARVRARVRAWQFKDADADNETQSCDTYEETESTMVSLRSTPSGQQLPPSMEDSPHMRQIVEGKAGQGSASSTLLSS